MKARLTNLGIEISAGIEDAAPPSPAPDADQVRPRRSYVYAHLDSKGKIFCIGKGDGRRAWSKDRHFIWQRYVDKYLGGNYQVRILQDNLSSEEAEEVEAEWIAHYCDDVVNWFNLGRPYDHEALERHNVLQAANRSLIEKAKAVEKHDLTKAAQLYGKAIDALKEYASINWERGIIGKILAEDDAEFGVAGEIDALDRLTICLIKLGKAAEAAEHVKCYFQAYRRDVHRGAAEAIRKRISKALARPQPRT